MPRPRSALIALALAGWGLAAWFLWQTEVPDDLRLPHVEPGDAVSAGEERAASDFEEFLRFDFLLSQVAVVGALALYAVFGPRFLRESASGRIGSGMLLAMLGLAFVWIVSIPFSVAELWWSRRHDLSEESYGERVLGGWLALGGEFLFICLAILIVMGLAGPLRDRWWIPGGAVFVGLAGLFTFVYPYLIPEQEPLRDPALSASAREYARDLGVEGVGVRVERVGELTDAPNAEAVGLGPTRRVILWDTLLDPRFSDDEVRVVLAHELGHHARDHLPKSIAWYALFAFPGAFIIARVTRRRGGMRRPEAVPLGLFMLVALNLLALPVQNAITRHLEAEADWVALETTEKPDAARALFARFTTEALADPEPPTWAFVLVDSHPTVVERIAMAEAWAERGGR